MGLCAWLSCFHIRRWHSWHIIILQYLETDLISSNLFFEIALYSIKGNGKTWMNHIDIKPLSLTSWRRPTSRQKNVGEIVGLCFSRTSFWWNLAALDPSSSSCLPLTYLSHIETWCSWGRNNPCLHFWLCYWLTVLLWKVLYSLKPITYPVVRINYAL